MGPVIMSPFEVIVVGGGLAGCEACWQLARRNIPVTLIEMKPLVYSPAHRSPLLCELVCSNSLKSLQTETATGTLKQELSLLDSLIVKTAFCHAIPAGNALSVEREAFSMEITEKLERHPLVRIEHRLIRCLDELSGHPAILATGPLTHPDLADDLIHRTGSDALYFYDATSPIIYADTIDMSVAFRGSRYGKGGNDYLNIPLTQEQYEKFVDDILGAKKVPLHSFESVSYYEGCMPIEVLAERGRETLAYGPMKPVGFVDPVTGKQPYAVVQLRQETLSGNLFSMVGFQTKMTFPEQKRVFRSLPGLEHAEFARLGTIHRNFYLNSPKVLTPKLEFKEIPGIFLAGQITGVEGYIESTALGLLSALFCLMKDKPFYPPPPTTVLGGLYRHVTTPQQRFSPMGANWGLVTPLEGKVKRKEKKRVMATRALRDIREWEMKISELLQDKNGKISHYLSNDRLLP